MMKLYSMCIVSFVVLMSSVNFCSAVCDGNIDDEERIRCMEKEVEIGKNAIKNAEKFIDKVVREWKLVIAQKAFCEAFVTEFSDCQLPSYRREHAPKCDEYGSEYFRKKYVEPCRDKMKDLHLRDLAKVVTRDFVKVEKELDLLRDRIPLLRMVVKDARSRIRERHGEIEDSLN